MVESEGVDPQTRGADVLFVVPCRNEEAHIARILDTLLSDEGCNEALIVVVDGESEDASPKIVQAYSDRHPRVRILDNPKRLQSAGINLAVERFGEAMGYLIRVDAHADYPDGYGSGLVRAALQSQADSVVVPMVAKGFTCFQKAAAAAQNSKLSNGGAAHRSGGVSGWVDHGHHALMRLEAFRAVGGYNEAFATNEDAELDLRLGKAGFRVWMSADHGIVYHPRSRPQDLWRQYFRYGRGRARTLKLHRVQPKLRQWIPIVLGPALLVTFLTPVTPLALTPFIIWVGACSAYGVRLGLSSKDPCESASGAAALVMHLAWSAGYWAETLFSGKSRTAPQGLVSQAGAQTR